jgi:hypothetical protein
MVELSLDQLNTFIVHAKAAPTSAEGQRTSRAGPDRTTLNFMRVLLLTRIVTWADPTLSAKRSSTLKDQKLPHPRAAICRRG